MEQTVLTPWQKSAVNTVANELALTGFYLSGGTALAAYYLHHRFSDDLDFFVGEKPDTVFLHSFVEKLRGVLGASAVRYEKVYDRNQYFFTIDDKECKVEFTLYPFPSLGRSLKKGGMRIDSLRDISANKVMAMLDRFDPKDFVDLYFLLQRRSLEELRDDAQKKFDMTISNIFLGGELAKVRRIVALPTMLKPLSIEELRTFFSQQAKLLGSAVLGGEIS